MTSAAHGFADGEDHARAAQPDEPRCAPPDTVGVRVMGERLPGFFAPRRKIVNGQDGRRGPKIGNFEVGAVKNLRSGLADCVLNAPEPPAALGGAVRLASANQIHGRALRHRERLVGEQRVDVFGKFARQRDGEFADVARQSAGGERQRRGIESDAHVIYAAIPSRNSGWDRCKVCGLRRPGCRNDRWRRSEARVRWRELCSHAQRRAESESATAGCCRHRWYCGAPKVGDSGRRSMSAICSMFMAGVQQSVWCR